MPLLFSSLLLRAQHPLSPKPDFATALWVAKADGINKIATADGSALLQIADVKNVRAVTVDEQRGVLWAYIQNTLWAYHFNGKPAFGVPLSLMAITATAKKSSSAQTPKMVLYGWE